MESDRFEALLRPHFEALYSAARRLTLGTTPAEDLVQEVCIKAFARLEEFKKIEYQRAWLLKVLYHTFIDDQRASQRSPIGLAETGLDSAEPDEMTASSRLPEDLAENELRLARVLRAMRCLSGDQCMLVALHDIEGFSIEELSRLTGQPAGTVKSQLHRTRAKLGRLLTNKALSKPKLKAIGN